MTPRPPWRAPDDTRRVVVATPVAGGPLRHPDEPSEREQTVSTPRLPRRTPGATSAQYEAVVAPYTETDASTASGRRVLPRAAEEFRTQQGDPMAWSSAQFDAFLDLGGAQ